MKEQSIISIKSFDFVLKIGGLYTLLRNNNEFVISKQILRCGTSIGANVEEATAAQSRKDFVAKMYIASKEAREVGYWLKLLDQSQLVKHNFDEYLNDANQLINILTKIIKTTQSTPALTNS